MGGTNQGRCAMRLRSMPLTPGRWADFEALFRSRGCSVARGCWCMYYRVSGERSGWPTGGARSEANRQAMKALVDGGEPTGLLGYREGVPVGWVSLGPRERYPKLERSPVMRPVDAKPVWSIVCFVVPAEFRKQGVAQALLDAAVAYARKKGARIVEGYPVDRRGASRDDSLWFGTRRMFERAGFEVVARRKPTRPVMRRTLRPRRGP
jgi:ribosomal protein S18 acetylase RimI-like enzyme